MSSDVGFCVDVKVSRFLQLCFLSVVFLLKGIDLIRRRIKADSR